MNNSSEKTGVTVASVLITIFLVFALTICIPLVALRFTLLNSSFITKTFTSGASLETITTILNETISENISSENYDINLDIDTEILDQETVKELMDVLVSGILEGEVSPAKQDKLNDNLYEDLFSYLESSGKLTSEEFENFKSTYEDKPLVNFDDILASDNSDSIAKGLKAINTFLTVFVAIVLIIALLLAAVMIFIHIKKYRGVRKVGIALTIAGAVDSLFAGFLCFTIAASLKSSLLESSASKLETQIFEAFSEIFTKLFTPTLYISIGALIVGIATIVAASIIGKNSSKVYL